MGNSQSKSQFLECFQFFLDLVVTLKCMVAQVIRPLSEAIKICLTEDERTKLEVLEEKKRKRILKIAKFLAFLKLVLQSKQEDFEKGVLVELKDEDTLFDGYSLKEVLESEAEACKQLASEYGSFAAEVETFHKSEVIVRKVVGAILIVAGILGAAALIWLSCGAATPLAVHISVLIAGVAVGLGAVTAGAIMVSPSEAEQAKVYLEKTAHSLRSLAWNFNQLAGSIQVSPREAVFASFDICLKKIDELLESLEGAFYA